MTYAILDLETTGIHPTAHDRIIEVGIVRLDENLRPQGEFSTLTNPERDLGPTWLHGVQACDVREAPTFPEIAGLVSEFLDGALLVGHNVGFDLRFLLAEYARSGHELPPPSRLDTMSLAVRAGADSRRLEEACDLFQIEIEEQHAALSDARATAELFTCCVHHIGRDEVLACVRPGAAGFTWPRIPAARRPFPRTAAAQGRETEGFLARLVTELPATSVGEGEWQEYFALLDRALEDRRLTAEEKEARSLMPANWRTRMRESISIGVQTNRRTIPTLRSANRHRFHRGSARQQVKPSVIRSPPVGLLLT